MQSLYTHLCDPGTVMHTHVMCLTSAHPCTWIRVNQPGTSRMLPVRGPATPQILCRLSALYVSPGGSAGTSLALQLLNPLQPAGLLRTCLCLAHVVWPRVSGQLISSHLPTCVPERIHRPGSGYPPPFQGSLRSLPPTPLPGDSQRPKLNPHLLAGG